MGKNILIGFKNQLNIGCSFLNAIFKIYCFHQSGTKPKQVIKKITETSY